MSQHTPASGFSLPLYLHGAAGQRSQPALTISAQGEILAVAVRQVEAQQNQASAATGADAHPAGVEGVLAANGNTVVEARLIPDSADPALDPTLAVSQQHAPPGASVTITATVRNLGPALAEGLSVRLYAGLPGSGALLDTVHLAPALEFNDSLPVAFHVTSAGGSQPLYAEVDSAGADISADNNRAPADLGTLAPPTGLTVHQTRALDNALQLSWIASPASGVEGYRILRRESLSGTHQLVGESTGTAFMDTLLE
jgi:hypothetical protein